MAMSSFTPWPLYPPGKHTPAPTEQYLNMSYSWSAGFGEENILVPLPGIAGEKGYVLLRVRIFLYHFVSTSSEWHQSYCSAASVGYPPVHIAAAASS